MTESCEDISDESENEIDEIITRMKEEFMYIRNISRPAKRGKIKNNTQ